MESTPTVKQRTSYIGGSDAAAVLGLNAYNPVYDVWREKTGQKTGDFDNKHTKRGNYMEPVILDTIRKEFDPTVNSVENFLKHDYGVRQRREAGWSDSDLSEYATGRVEADEQLMVRHPNYPFAGGHPDGVGDTILWEFKAPAMRNVERRKSEGISITWFYQNQHYMMCTGLKRGAIVMWDYDNWEPYIVWYDADPALHERMLKRYADFWEDVELGVPPIAINDFHHDQITVIQDEALESLLARYKQAYEWRYYGKDQQSNLKGKILSAAAGRKTLITPNFRASIADVNGKYSNYTRLVVKEKE